ncbi:exonuclease domain-containing protein [Chitinimonas koreensis]|uniref:exonuclease domain-containing protein n=1 Tax=Chitinimonas koreensis TaxID=356302 RepID=UPI0016542D03|nr:exonuclease domain-containing protein [Chitinimonas koreensis]QNM94670.1 ethanolamine utilization protein [Chitinimonas koreensis]
MEFAGRSADRDPAFISRLTGITDAMVAGAPTFAALAPALLERLQGGVFVAHNARFDYGFLKHEFKRVGIDFRARVVCTVKLSRRLFPGEYKHNLDAVAERNGLYVDGDRHRALTDARLIHQFVDKLSRELSMDALAAALDEVSRPPNLPPGIDPEQVESIPDGHGVYLFYGEDDQPLYVGGGDNLKKKVLAHFAAGPKGRAAKLAPLVRRLDWVSTAGELGAQLLEARLLRELQPSHNPRPRRDEAVCAWRFEPNEDGSAQPELVQADRHDFGRDPHLYGLYGSAREAQNTLRKIAEANRLCTVALGLDRAGRKGGTPCFGMQVGRCRGACVGKEPLLTHQARLCAILAKQRLQRWPFKGWWRSASRTRPARPATCTWSTIGATWHGRQPGGAVCAARAPRRRAVRRRHLQDPGQAAERPAWPGDRADGLCGRGWIGLGRLGRSSRGAALVGAASAANGGGGTGAFAAEAAPTKTDGPRFSACP